MALEHKINVEPQDEFSTVITIDDVPYHVITEDLRGKTNTMVTNIYFKGAVVYSKKYDYSQFTKQKDLDNRVRVFMEKQHKSAIDDFLSDKSPKKKSKPDCFNEVQQFLKAKKPALALNALKAALQQFPSDPFLLSYYGCLVALVEDNPKDGIRICNEAIRILKNTVPFGSEFLYPVFYLNSGRAYLKGNKKREAINAFQKGLKLDSENRNLLEELKKLGARKNPPISLLKRSNPLNKYIGLLLSRIS